MKLTATNTELPSRPARAVLTCLLIAACLAFAAFTAPKASADFAIKAFDGLVLDADGEGFSQAGGHPHTMSTTFELETETNPWGQIVPKGGTLGSVRVDLPAGVVGNPTVAETCTTEQITDDDLDNLCPIDSIVGNVQAVVSDSGGRETAASPLHLMDPPPNVPARFAFNLLGEAAVFLDAELRDDGTYGISVGAAGLSDTVTALGSTVTIWGTPADPAHDDHRCVVFIIPEFNQCMDFGGALPPPFGPNSSSLPERALLTNPTRCTEPGVGLESTLHVTSWFGTPRFSDTATFESHEPPGFDPGDPATADPSTWGPPQGPDGCEDVPFNPQVSFEPSSSSAGSPTAALVEVSVPQHGLVDPERIATAHLKDTEVTLPQGMAINPSAANGLASCSPNQIGLESKSPVRFNNADPMCPDAAKIGTVQIDTPVLEEDLTGHVYIAEQGNNPFDSTFALYVVAQGSGVTIKLPGKVSPDPNTGRLKTTFDDAPQLPFSTFKLRFRGGERAPLVNPPTCGTKTVRADFVPWSAADPDNPTSAEIRTRTDSFEVTRGPNGQPCPASLADRPFELGMSSGLVNPVAGASSPFSMRMTRQDGHQEIRSIALRTPEGLTANLSGIPMCSEAQAEAGSCPAASKVGSAVTGAGAGSSPVYVSDGEVFLTGPYNGAPLGLLVQVPAKAGPFDLGMVDVRSALHVNPRTAQVHVESDPIPRILEGVPLNLRDIRIQMDRENFTLAPTNCQAKEVLGWAGGSHGASASLSNHFQVGDCAALDFAPRFGMQILNPGRRSTLRSFNPAMRFSVAPREGHANIGRAAVTLPRSIILDQSNIRTVCTRADFAAENCPDGAIYGWARAWSPLLDEPLQGPVYLGSSPNPLPDLIADLHGQVRVTLQGEIVGTRDGRMRNIFQVVPDVAVSFFQLQIMGGRDRGILVNSTDLCRSANRGVANFQGQNGKRQVTRPRVGLTFRGCRQVRRKAAQRQVQRRAAVRKAVRAGKITPAQARRAIRS